MQEPVTALPRIFSILKELLQSYSPPFTVRVDEERRYELWSEKEAVIAGRKRAEVFFASIIIQKNYVGFYFMPVYSTPEIKELFHPALLSLLKGKSCFHIRRLDDALLAQVSAALHDGHTLYQTRGWV